MVGIESSYRRLLSLALFLGLMSCNIVGLTDGYSRLSKSDKDCVFYSSRGGKGRGLKMLNGKELSLLLDSAKVNIVYYFNPYCSGDECYPISSVIHRAPKDANVIIVTRAITSDILRSNELYKVYGIDKFYYGKKYLYAYEDKFFNDLTGRDSSKNDSLPLYIFNGRHFLRTSKLEDL